MANEFKQPTKDYGDYGHPPHEYPETVFLRARQEHDMRMGTLYLNSRQWRIFAYLLIIAFERCDRLELVLVYQIQCHCLCGAG